MYSKFRIPLFIDIRLKAHGYVRRWRCCQTSTGGGGGGGGEWATLESRADALAEEAVMLEVTGQGVCTALGLIYKSGCLR